MPQARKGAPPKARGKQAAAKPAAPPAQTQEPDPRIAELEAQVAELKAQEAAPTGDVPPVALAFIRKAASGRTDIKVGEEARAVLDELDLPYKG